MTLLRHRIYYKDKKGWWYDLGHGAYYRKCWQKIDGIRYSFDKKGYLIK